MYWTFFVQKLFQKNGFKNYLFILTRLFWFLKNFNTIVKTFLGLNTKLWFNVYKVCKQTQKIYKALKLFEF